MYKLLRPLLFRLDAERAHTLSIGAARMVQALGCPLVDPVFGFEDERLQQTIWGHTFPNPVGLAAGADKNARLVSFWEAVGFGFVEVGSVTARPSSGNPKPRAFRLPEDRAIINRLGLNNDGAEVLSRRLAATAHTRPLGVNIAKTHAPDIMGEAAVEDFRASFRRLAPHASYVALNISCPNTREGKTFEDADALDALLTAIRDAQDDAAHRAPLLLKLSPLDSERVIFDEQLEAILDLADAHAVDGFIASNTASDREGLQTPDARLDAIGAGGLSGPPLAARSTRLVRYLYQATDGRIPIVGVGGVESAASAYQKIRAGASLLQLYTGLVYEGPGLVRRIKKGLVERLDRDGFATLTDAVGAGVEAETRAASPAKNSQPPTSEAR